MNFHSLGRHLLCAAMLLAAGAAGAEPVPAAKLLPALCQIVFVTRQMGVPVEGSFKKFDAQVAFDPRKPEGGSVALQIDVGSASLGIPQSDAELPKPAWFDSHRFPKAEFQSNAIKALGGGRFEIAGRLTIKGSTTDLLVPVEIAQSNGQSTATGSFTIQRLAYKIGDGEWTDTSMVADDVQVRFKLVLAGLGPL
ncbi:YceI family protein [Variovorax saccharolyticus]|uniref:YceI family protein n=1 Tax=Variovorax saccharolyticus TaxID=3053516 RepID=UPI002575CC87|nr:YceI family protein [Variovorax sp. J31P216]MDM0027893.1 YceI family protein [Variovorax sp. J31P216]